MLLTLVCDMPLCMPRSYTLCFHCILCGVVSVLLAVHCSSVYIVSAVFYV